MASVTLKGKSVHTAGDLPPLGSLAPSLPLTKADLTDVSLADFEDRVRIINIVPSLDTSVCALSAKRFEAEIAKLPEAVVLTVSRDLPFAQERFCKAEGLSKVVFLSELRHREFGARYGVELVDGPLAGLLARAVVVVGKDGHVAYTQLVPEISTEPDYAKAMEAVKRALAG
jgi:thioredoxin-dependent peroxiredoxin